VLTNKLQLKSIFFFIIFVSICFEVVAQEKIGVNSDKQEKKINQNHTSVFKVGYGIGNVWVYLLKHNSFFIDYVPNYKVKSTGPITVCYENFLLKKISVGLAVSYSIVKGKGSSRGIIVDDQISMFTALIRGNYHFGKSKKLDSYVGGGLGYIRSAYKSNPSVSGPVPGEFGYSAQLGAHYYLTNHVGFYGELGYVNGSFLQLGVVISIP